VIPGITDDIVGKACTADTDCGKGSCIGAGTTDAGVQKGTCTAACQKDTDCGATEGYCGGIIYGSAGQCAEKCNESSDCKRADEGYTCTALPGGGQKTCLPGTPTTGGDDAGTGGDGDSDAGTKSDAG
jgi:hypothetical protein